MKSTILLLAASVATLHAQGPLTSPGAPGPTMKTLAQIEGRTPIESLPFTISQSGSYYFTGNLQFNQTSGNAITITSNNVTLDLNGFTLSSIGTVTGEAIHLADTLNNITIKNGNIAGSSTATPASGSTVNILPAGFSIGISAPVSSDYSLLAIKDLQISGCRNDGISAAFGSITACNAHHNGGNGIRAIYGSVTGCTSTQNGGAGIDGNFGIVIDSIASANSYGIAGSDGIVSGCTADSNKLKGISAGGGIVVNSLATHNGTAGISATNGSISGSTSQSNGAIGIESYEGTVTNCHADFNVEDGITASACSVTNCTATGNAKTGISAPDSNVIGCTASRNGWYGIAVGNGSVTNCRARSNNVSGGANLDLYAVYSAVAFCRYGTADTTGSTLTGNKTP